jgi:hypothetical protein
MCISSKRELRRESPQLFTMCDVVLRVLDDQVLGELTMLLSWGMMDPLQQQKKFM